MYIMQYLQTLTSSIDKVAKRIVPENLLKDLVKKEVKDAIESTQVKAPTASQALKTARQEVTFV